MSNPTTSTREYFELQRETAPKSGKFRIIARSAKTVEQAREQRTFYRESDKALEGFVALPKAGKFRIVHVKAECTVIE